MVASVQDIHRVWSGPHSVWSRSLLLCSYFQRASLSLSLLLSQLTSMSFLEVNKIEVVLWRQKETFVRHLGQLIISQDRIDPAQRQHLHLGLGSGGRSSPLSGPETCLKWSCTPAQDREGEGRVWFFLETLSQSDFQVACLGLLVLSLLKGSLSNLRKGEQQLQENQIFCNIYY